LQIDLVLANLIRNAIDAAAGSPARRGRVDVRVTHDTKAAQVAVEDDGPGLSPEMADALFQPFASDKPGGMGLGLYLSRQIVESHGGTLTYEPAQRAGTLFTVRLPC
jgi:two-component system sensor kinase FixL